MELTNNLRKQIQSLSEAKHRRSLGLFKAEGTKCVLDTIESFKLKYLIATNSWIEENNNYSTRPELIKVSPGEMKRLSSLSTASQVIAIYEIPRRQLDVRSLKHQLVLALDCIQDPGNLGTIVRTADWFGIKTILASHDTVDIYSPKVVQATMGAISRVSLHYCNLYSTVESLNDCKIYGTFLNGENLYSTTLAETGIIIMGNEGRGISREIAQLVNCRLTIPSYPLGEVTSESLNVATATAITIAEFRRQTS